MNEKPRPQLSCLFAILRFFDNYQSEIYNSREKARRL